MYVCICNAVTEREIEAVAAAGALDFDQLQESLPVATCCGQCRDAAEACLSRARPVADAVSGA